MQKVKLSSRFDADDIAAHAEAVRERSTEKETLQPGVFMRAKDHGLGEGQFDRIRCTTAYAASYDKDKVWFHSSEAHFQRTMSARRHYRGS